MDKETFLKGGRYAFDFQVFTFTPAENPSSTCVGSFKVDNMHLCNVEKVTDTKVYWYRYIFNKECSGSALLSSFHKL